MSGFRSVVAVIACLVASTAAQAQSLEQPVRIVMPYAAGSVGDAVARLIAESMRPALGSAVIVDNKTGASGRIGVRAVKEAPADGSVLLFTPIAPMAIFPSVYRRLDYDPAADFQAISQVATFDFGLAIGPAVPAKTVQELVAWLRNNPSKASFATPGAGTLPHFCAVLLAKAVGIELVHVPYKGNPPALADLIGGHIAMFVTSTQDLVEAHKSGRVRVLATSGPHRSPILPDVPTFKEAGYDIEGAGWYGLYAPARTPKSIIDRVNGIVVSAVRTPAFKERLLAMGLVPTGTSSTELAAIQKRDTAFWAPAIHASGFKADE